MVEMNRIKSRQDIHPNMRAVFDDRIYPALFHHKPSTFGIHFERALNFEKIQAFCISTEIIN